MIIIIIVAVCVGALGAGLFMWCRMRIRKRTAMKVRTGPCAKQEWNAMAQPLDR